MTGGSLTLSSFTTTKLSASSYRLTPTMSATPTGVETLDIDVTASQYVHAFALATAPTASPVSPVYLDFRVVDGVGNAAATDAKSVTLNDKKVPTFTMAVQADNTLLVTFDEAVTDEGGAALTFGDFAVTVDAAAVGSGSVSGSGTTWTITLTLSATPVGTESVAVDVTSSKY